ncbi:MAG: fibrillarin-like rRNA/tRNA 2'-O-methyltransferase [Candidatus Aenigmatarchaeota archaeon]
MKQVFEGVWRKNDDFYTRNPVPGEKVYGEKLIKEEDEEYRRWDPKRSKLAAALKNGLEDFPIESDDKVLYLGAAQGTTPSHISDVLVDGFVYLVEFSERAMRDLLGVCEERKNTAPILADARKPKDYGWVEKVDVVYEDVAQPDQVEILKRNAKYFLRDGGLAVIAVKARATDVAEEPKKIYEKAKKEMEEEFEVLEFLELDPWEKDHCLIVARKN